jgi:hypothetical protein
MRRSFFSLVGPLFFFAIANTCASPAVAQQMTRVEHVTFETNVEPNVSGTPTVVRALLYIPAQVEQPIPAVVIISSSGGVRDDVEIHYATNLAWSGIAALVIDSFGARGVAHTIHDQRQVNDW